MQMPFLFVKEWLRNLLSRFFAVGLFFLSKNGSETFCQGFLLQAISFCQRVAQKPFVKVFFAAGPFFLSKNDFHFCQVIAARHSF